MCVNTNDQSNACMCEMMSKGSKEALTVSIVTHVKGDKSGVCGFYANTLYKVMLLILLMSKGLKVYYTLYKVASLPFQGGSLL